MSDKIRILFVDDEPKILDGLRRMLRPMRWEWEMSFAGGGAEALALLEHEPHDIIVSDIRMPGMTGIELLEEVRRRFPQVIRIALSGQASRETVFRTIGPTHQYLPKPCDMETLKAAIGRVGMLRELLAADSIRGTISAMESLPSLPALYDELSNALLSSGVSVKSVGRIVSKDIGMSGKVLQLVSSGFFGPARYICSPAEAVEVLGIDIIKPLVLSIHTFSQFAPADIEDFAMEALWQRSLAIAAGARKIADAEKTDGQTIDAAFLAGMLHDVGTIIFVEQLADDYHRAVDLAKTEGIDLLEAERKTLGATHAQVGAYLLGIWGLPDPIIEAVAYHHRPSASHKATEFTALTAVHAAGALNEAWPVETEYLAGLGLMDRLPAWRQICQETAQKEAVNV